MGKASRRNKLVLGFLYVILNTIYGKRLLHVAIVCLQYDSNFDIIKLHKTDGSRRGRGRMVVGFTTT